VIKVRLFETRRALHANGNLALEVRNRDVEEWHTWTTQKPKTTAAGTVESTVRVEGDLVTHTDHWIQGGRAWTTTETLRFPSWQTMTAGLTAAALKIIDSWGDFDRHPIRPSSPEWIILARPTPPAPSAPAW
jgi:hypothetical protein